MRRSIDYIAPESLELAWEHKVLSVDEEQERHSWIHLVNVHRSSRESWEDSSNTVQNPSRCFTRLSRSFRIILCFDISQNWVIFLVCFLCLFLFFGIFLWLQPKGSSQRRLHICCILECRFLPLGFLTFSVGTCASFFSSSLNFVCEFRFRIQA